ncbi:ABC transporter permease [Pseudactinotalea sp. HY158]|uniref:ABC transporter permease n=1 Tax=Pseudactinotalea sp. HY158 TaxID=2654547 RepID=UPI00129C7F0A|nr:ABC transporter permease [Pseudactinotalea sp. HY158]QGH68156.1 ABC transporter permease [Pseudactinotalea sp. HY158]
MNAVVRKFSQDRNLSVISVLTLTTLMVLIATLGGRFLSAGNLQSMGTQVAEFGLLALAMGLAMLLGGIDLSIVSAAVLAGIVGTKFLAGDVIAITPGNESMVMVLGAVAMLVTGMACGLLNGLLIAKVSVPPILATLATLIFFAGVGMVITDGQSVPVTIPGFAELGVATVATVPVVFVVMALVFLVVGFMLRRTRTGRRIYLYGENNVALRFTGVRNERLVIITYVLIGLIVGVAAMIMVSRVNSARVGFGESYLLQAILVVVLAGFDPYGGRGRVASLVLGLVLLQSLQSAFTILRFDPYMKTFIWGAALLLIMVIHHVLNIGSGRRSREKEPGTPPIAGPQQTLVDAEA